MSYLVKTNITYSRIKLQSLSGIFHNSFASKYSILQCDFPRAHAKFMFYRLAGRALVGRVHTQLIRISVSLGSDKLNVTLSYASASQTAFSQGNFKVKLKALPTLGAPEACVISSLGSKLTKIQPCPFKYGAIP